MLFTKILASNVRHNLTAQQDVWRENFNSRNSLFFVFFGALFEQNRAAQTGILTNKSHYEETRSFEFLNFPAKLQAELFDVTHTLPAPRWRRLVVEFWASSEKDFVGFKRSLEA